MKPINLTIIMPTYNRAKLLRENIKSLLKSDYSFELLIINDGSSDETEEVVKSFRDPRIVYRRHPFRCGYAKSLNEGIERSRNSRVLLLEDDAFILNPDVFLETLLHEKGYKQIVATHLLSKGKEIKLNLLERSKRFFAEPLAGEIYLYNGRKRKIVRFCNACCSFNKEEIKTRFEESDYFGNAFRVESDFQIRARKEGAAITYDPKLLVDHRRYSTGGHRVHDKDEYLYQCMVNHMIFSKKHYSIWNIFIYVLLKLLAHPTKWFIVKETLKEYVLLDIKS